MNFYKVFKTLKGVIRYVKGILCSTLTFKLCDDRNMCGYVDSAWLGNMIDRKLITGYVDDLNVNLVDRMKLPQLVSKPLRQIYKIPLEKYNSKYRNVIKSDLLSKNSKVFGQPYFILIFIQHFRKLIFAFNLKNIYTNTM